MASSPFAGPVGPRQETESLEQRMVFLRALKDSPIKTARTKIPDDSRYWSWSDKERVYIHHNIFPGVLYQGKRSICMFCAVISAAQMELNAEFARRGQRKCNIRLQLESLLERYFELHKLSPKDEEERKTCEDQLIEKGLSPYDLDDAVCWIMKNIGASAVVDEGKEAGEQSNDDKNVGEQKEPVGDSDEKKVSAMEFCKRWGPSSDETRGEKLSKSSLFAKTDSTLNLVIDDYAYFMTMGPNTVWEHVENGRAVIAGLFCGDELDLLEGDEIYCYIPAFHPDTHEPLRRTYEHAIVLMGNGVAPMVRPMEELGPCMNSFMPSLVYEQFHPFLNSYRDKYANGGVGSVFYKSFYFGHSLLEMKSARNVSPDWTKLTADNCPKARWKKSPASTGDTSSPPAPPSVALRQDTPDTATNYQPRAPLYTPPHRRNR